MMIEVPWPLLVIGGMVMTWFGYFVASVMRAAGKMADEPEEESCE